MIKFVVSFFIFTTNIFAIYFYNKLENTNILTKPKNQKLNDQNRFRIYSTIEDKKYEDFLIKLIIDNTNTYNITNKNKTKLYRGYFKYSGEKHLVIAGVQRIPFGVGRVWNPIDIFNPIDFTSIEIDQREGTKALRYEYAIDEVSNIDLTYSKEKSSIRIKGYLNFADIALVALKDNKKKIDILGYEIEGELFNTGVELRAEGGIFNKDYNEYILGFEYGFENSFNILAEYKNNTLLNVNYLGLILAYQPIMLINLNLSAIENLKDNSKVIMPSIKYSLDDDINLDIGIFNYTGKNTTEYGKLNNSFFIKALIYW
jgi:hypothetical protein